MSSKITICPFQPLSPNTVTGTHQDPATRRKSKTGYRYKCTGRALPVHVHQNLRVIGTALAAAAVRMGDCFSCCNSSYDEEEARHSLLADRSNNQSEEARRKAAEAALRRAGTMAQRARPAPRQDPRSNTRLKSAISEGMRWEGG